MAVVRGCGFLTCAPAMYLAMRHSHFEKSSCTRGPLEGWSAGRQGVGRGSPHLTRHSCACFLSHQEQATTIGTSLSVSDMRGRDQNFLSLPPEITDRRWLSVSLEVDPRQELNVLIS